MVSDLKLLLIKGNKLQRQKSFYSFFFICPLCLNFFGPTFQSPMSIFFRFSEYLGKSNGKNKVLIYIIYHISYISFPSDSSKHHYSQTFRARDLTLQTMFTTLSVSCVTCPVSHVTYHVSHVTCHMYTNIYIKENMTKHKNGERKNGTNC